MTKETETVYDKHPVWGSFRRTYIVVEGRRTPVQWVHEAPAQEFERPDGSTGKLKHGWCYYRYWNYNDVWTLFMGRSFMGAGDIPVRKENYDFLGFEKKPEELNLDFLDA